MYIYTQDRPCEIKDREYVPEKYPLYNFSNYRGEFSFPRWRDRKKISDDTDESRYGSGPAFFLHTARLLPDNPSKLHKDILPVKSGVLQNADKKYVQNRSKLSPGFEARLYQIPAVYRKFLKA